MSKNTLGVGLVGVQPVSSWAARAHIPALQAMPENFHIAGIANTSLASAQKAVEAIGGVGRAFADVGALIASSEVDVVAVTVKVPHHLELVKAALQAGKHVYCEWPVGNGLEEAREMAALARETGLVAVAGTQARVAPAMLQVRQLVASGYVGEVLSTTLIGSGMNWGAVINQRNAYTLDVENGASMLTIPFGHTLSAVADVLGGVASVSAVLATRRKTVRVVETGEDRPMTSPDQILVAGLLKSGVPISIHYRGGKPRGNGLLWEIYGTHGEIQVTGNGGHTQFVELAVKGAQGDAAALVDLPLPAPQGEPHGLDIYGAHVATLYRQLAADVRDGTRTAPTFDDALQTHRLIAAIELAAREGRVVMVEAL